MESIKFKLCGAKSVSNMSGCGAIFILLVVILNPQPSDSVGLESVVSVMKLAHDVVKGITFTWNALAPDRTSLDGGVEFPLLRGEERHVIEKIEELSRQIDRVELQQKVTAEGIVHSLMREIPRLLRFELKMDKLEDFVGIVNSADLQLKRYIERGYDNSSDENWHLEQHTLENFASWVVSHHPNSVRGVVERIHTVMVPGLFNKRGMFAMFANSIRSIGSGTDITASRGQLEAV